MEKSRFNQAGFCILLNAWIEECGSLREAERRSGVNYSTLSHIAAGRKPDVDSLYKIAPHLGVGMPEWQ